MKILYVEDNSHDADLTRRELRRSAPYFLLEVATSQSQARECLQANNGYDLILIDLHLPDGDGFELLSLIRQGEMAVAVVVITGQGDEKMAVAALKAGADGYVVKRPGYLLKLAQALENAHKRYHSPVHRKARPLRVLFAEHNPLDGELTRQHFARHFPHIHLDVVNDVQGLKQGLILPDGMLAYDVLLLEYRLGDSSALDILTELLHERCLDVPVVLIANQGDEETAANALLLGASDYLVKNPGYLYLLAGLLENAFHRAELLREQAALEASEKRFQALIENSADGILLLDSQRQVRYASPSAMRILEFPLEEFLGNDLLNFIHSDEQDSFRVLWIQLHQEAGTILSAQTRFRHSDFSWRWMELTCVNSLTGPGVQGIIINFRDITVRRLNEERIQHQIQKLSALRTMDMAIATSMDLRVILAVLLESVISQLAVQAADVLLYDSQSQLLEYAAGRGFRDPSIESTRLALGEGMAGWVALERQMLHVTPGPELAKFKGAADFWIRESFASYFGIPLIAKGQIQGVLEIYHRAAFVPDQDWLNFYEALAGQAAIAVDSASLFEDLQRANTELLLAYDATLEGWVRALDLRDQETEGHTQRVATMTLRLSRAIGVHDEALAHIRRGAMLHDIGKMAISDYILRKPGPLSEEELKIVRKHPMLAYELLSPVPYLAAALDIPYCHHEKWDGSGYPRGLRGDQIPLAARIFAVVDVWDAITNDRIYRKGWDIPKAIEYMRFCSGSHFDPRVVEVFLDLLESNSLIT